MSEIKTTDEPEVGTSEGGAEGERAGPSRGFRPADVGAGLLIVVGVLLLGQVIVVAIDYAIRGTADGDPPAATNLALQLTVVIGFLSVPIIYGLRRFGDGLVETLRRLGLLRISGAAFGFALVGFVVYFILAAVMLTIFGEPSQDDITETFGVDEGPLIGLIAAGLLIIPGAAIAEEVLFRGFVFGGLRRAMPFALAAVLSGVLFGALHLVSGDLLVAAQLSLFGIILAAVYERTGSLWTPILIHAINNTLAFLSLVGAFG